MVGPNLKKNSVYDVIHYKKTFVSPKSEYQYIPTTEVAKIILELKNESKEIFNLCGDSTLVVEEIFKMANIDTKPELFDLRIEKYEVNIDKIKSKTQIPKTIDSVKQYVKDNQ